MINRFQIISTLLLIGINTTANILRPDERAYVHRVKAGETLFGAAKKYGVAVQDIKAWNGLKSEKMRVGQDLLIYLP